MRRAQLARLVAQVTILGDGGEVGGAHVNPRDKILRAHSASIHASDVLLLVRSLNRTDAAGTRMVHTFVIDTCRGWIQHQTGMRE